MQMSSCIQASSIWVVSSQTCCPLCTGHWQMDQNANLIYDWEKQDGTPQLILPVYSKRWILPSLHHLPNGCHQHLRSRSLVAIVWGFLIRKPRNASSSLSRQFRLPQAYKLCLFNSLHMLHLNHHSHSSDALDFNQDMLNTAETPKLLRHKAVLGPCSD